MKKGAKVALGIGGAVAVLAILGLFMGGEEDTAADNPGSGSEEEATREETAEPVTLLNDAGANDASMQVFRDGSHWCGGTVAEGMFSAHKCETSPGVHEWDVRVRLLDVKGDFTQISDQEVFTADGDGLIITAGERGIRWSNDEDFSGGDGWNHD